MRAAWLMISFSFRVHILGRLFKPEDATAKRPYFHLDKDKIVLDICRETVEGRSSESAREKADGNVLDELIVQTYSVTNICDDASLIHLLKITFANWVLVDELAEHSRTSAKNLYK